MVIFKNGRPIRAGEVSAYRARKESEYPRLEKGLRACTTTRELAEFWRAEHSVIRTMPDHWQWHLKDEYARIAKLLNGED